MWRAPGIFSSKCASSTNTSDRHSLFMLCCWIVFSFSFHLLFFGFTICLFFLIFVHLPHCCCSFLLPFLLPFLLSHFFYIIFSSYSSFSYQYYLLFLFLCLPCFCFHRVSTLPSSSHHNLLFFILYISIRCSAAPRFHYTMACLEARSFHLLCKWDAFINRVQRESQIRDNNRSDWGRNRHHQHRRRYQNSCRNSDLYGYL